MSSGVLLVACGGGGSDVSDKDRFDAISAARVAYAAANKAGTDFGAGPCIGDPLPGLGGDWVADVAHDPRQAVDDRPRNQCSSYRSGRAHHFVELDPSGRVIRTQ